MTFGSEKTALSTGSVGVSPGTSINGNFTLINGTAEAQTQSSIAAAGELAAAYSSGSKLPCDHSLLTSNLSGDPLSAGVYCSSSGMFSVADMGVLVLDAHNVSGVTWIFHVSGNVSTGANSKVILKNGASAANVYWIVGGTVSVGRGSTIVGNILSPSMITIGASASLDGRALSKTKVVFMGNSIAHLPVIYSPRSLYPSFKPSSLSSSPASLANVASLCIISSVPSQFNQSAWKGTDVAAVMMEAIALSMGVPVSVINYGYADQLCLRSPTNAPTLRPTMTPTVTVARVRNLLDESSFASKALNFNFIHRRSPVQQETVSQPFKPLSFSIYRIVPGDLNEILI